MVVLHLQGVSLVELSVGDAKDGQESRRRDTRERFAYEWRVMISAQGRGMIHRYLRQVCTRLTNLRIQRACFGARPLLLPCDLRSAYSTSSSPDDNVVGSNEP